MGPEPSATSTAVLSVLPQAVPVGDRMELRDGKDLAEILRLPSTWPRAEAAEEGASGTTGDLEVGDELR